MVPAAQPVLDQAAPAIDKVVENAPLDRRPDNETLIKVDAGVKIVAGSLLARSERKSGNGGFKLVMR